MGSPAFASLGVLAVMFAAPLPGQSPVAAPGANARNWTMPRTPDGHPDLQGVWTNATITPLERPAALAGKATLTDAEAQPLEKKAADELAATDGQSESPLLAAAGS